MSNVKSLQRKLLFVGGGVAVLVGAAGWRLWSGMKSGLENRVAQLSQEVHESTESIHSEESGVVVVTRVLVRRRKDDPSDEGQVVSEQRLATLPVSSMKTMVDNNVKRDVEANESKNFVSSLKSLPMGQRVAMFAALVGAFVGLNALAVPRLRKLHGAQKNPEIALKQLLAQVEPKGAFVEVGCGAGGGKALLSALECGFAPVVGYDTHGVSMWRLKKALNVDGIRIEHVKAYDVAPELQNARVVLCGCPAADVPSVLRGVAKKDTLLVLGHSSPESIAELGLEEVSEMHQGPLGVYKKKT